MNFSDILASLIHDMKNSLGMVINTLDEVIGDPGFHYSDPARITALQQEARRLSNNLIELLTLYKIENERISAHIEEVYLEEFLEELVAENMASAEAKGIRLEYRCDRELSGYFDEGLIRGVINNLIGNGMRYTTDRLLLSAEMADGYLVLSVDDNGRGFPEEMLLAQEAADAGEGFNSGHTQLGIYFSEMVAGLHRNRDRTGYIRLSNDGRLAGGCFSLCLP